MNVPDYLSCQLTKQEIDEAKEAGQKRQTESNKKRLKNAYGKVGGRDLEDHILGALGERAFCKARQLPWKPPINTFKKGFDVTIRVWIAFRNCFTDIGYQIRTKPKHIFPGGALPYLDIRSGDADNQYFVLVSGNDSENSTDFRIHGYLLAKAARILAKENPRFIQRYGNDDRPPVVSIPANLLIKFWPKT